MLISFLYCLRTSPWQWESLRLDSLTLPEPGTKEKKINKIFYIGNTHRHTYIHTDRYSGLAWPPVSSDPQVFIYHIHLHTYTYTLTCLYLHTYRQTEMWHGTTSLKASEFTQCSHAKWLAICQNLIYYLPLACAKWFLALPK